MRSRLACFAAFFLVSALLLADSTQDVHAQNCASILWGESTTVSFVFTYQASAPLGAEIATQFGEALDAEFHRFSNLFKTSLPVPIMVRVYPNERTYYCFNALADEIPIGQTHSHIGGREIALIAQNINADRAAWETNGLEALRHELGVLFLNFVSAEKAPPGLQVGFGSYAENPFVTFESKIAAYPPPLNSPGATWRGLWESPNLVFSRENALQNASITAFLIDVYGWDRFLIFLNSLRTAESWRLALEETYPADPNAMEQQWSSTYYGLFFQGRWRENVLYGLSLEPFRQLIDAGAYQAASEGLAGIIAMLVDLEDFEKLSLAQDLNIEAQLGLQADALAGQARQAYLEQDFNAAVTFAEEAIGIYALLGDVRNLENLGGIRDQAEEVLALRDEMETFNQGAISFSGGSAGPRLSYIAARLTVLGDTEGTNLALARLDQINDGRTTYAAIIAGAGVLIAGWILVLRVRSAGHKPQPEARLHP